MTGKGTRIPDTSYSLVRARDFWRCFRCGCPAQPGQWHHRRSRSVVDEHQHEPCNGINLCPPCHSWVHAHPFEARTKGWIVSRHAIPCEVKVFSAVHFGWTTLGCDGSMERKAEDQDGE